ncbi:DUF4822 domain-containing protein [Lactococcus petauri]|uniref:DUF4822 domain-containing protein n=1 Tax=Lactococcus petauri TaxID=1940789 RepID=UPI0038534F9B
MKKNKIIITSVVLLLGVAGGLTYNYMSRQNAPIQETSKSSKSDILGDIYENTLSQTSWQGTKVVDAQGKDLTKENMNFIGLAKYDDKTGFYEFFDKETGETRGDEGTYFVTNDGTKRVLISTTKEYQALVEITELNEKKFTYKRMGVDKEGKEIEVYVEHVPYTDKSLSFTNGRQKLEKQTGEIDTSEPGSKILGSTLWNGTVVRDEDGNDVTAENQMFISLAKFDPNENKYEFFDLETGNSRGDFGYYDVLFNNKIRSHMSIGENKYGAVLELTELNDKKFTYKRVGKDKAGKDVAVYVEHEPYTGAFAPQFTF